MAFYFHILTTMHGQNHIKFVTVFDYSDHVRMELVGDEDLLQSVKLMSNM